MNTYELKIWSVEQAIKNFPQSSVVSICSDANALFEYASAGRMFFYDQDDDSRWYKIPYHLKLRWNQLKDRINGIRLEGDEFDDAINTEFSRYRSDSPHGEIFYQ